MLLISFHHYPVPWTCLWYFYDVSCRGSRICRDGSKFETRRAWSFQSVFRTTLPNFLFWSLLHLFVPWRFTCNMLMGLYGMGSAEVHNIVQSIFSSYPGWWFGTLYVFPYIGNSNPNWLIFFQRGWNHQPVSHCMAYFVYPLKSLAYWIPKPADLWVRWYHVWADTRKTHISSRSDTSWNYSISYIIIISPWYHDIPVISPYHIMISPWYPYSGWFWIPYLSGLSQKIRKS